MRSDQLRRSARTRGQSENPDRKRNAHRRVLDTRRTQGKRKTKADGSIAILHRGGRQGRRGGRGFRKAPEMGRSNKGEEQKGLLRGNPPTVGRETAQTRQVTPACPHQPGGAHRKRTPRFFSLSQDETTLLRLAREKIGHVSQRYDADTPPLPSQINSRPPKTNSLKNPQFYKPIPLHPPKKHKREKLTSPFRYRELVGDGGFEPSTPTV